MHFVTCSREFDLIWMSPSNWKWFLVCKHVPRTWGKNVRDKVSHFRFILSRTIKFFIYSFILGPRPQISVPQSPDPEYFFMLIPSMVYISQITQLTMELYQLCCPFFMIFCYKQLWLICLEHMGEMIFWSTSCLP